MPIHFVAIETDPVKSLQQGAPDANGQPPERRVSDGSGLPCRHCLADIEADAPYLVLAFRPFPAPQPYAELGPIFLHADTCERYSASADLPPMLDSPRYILRGYGKDNRIVYGSGRIAETHRISAEAEELFKNAEIAYAHVRSATNNCYQCRIERA